MNVETVPIVILIVIQLLNKTDRIRKGEQLSLYKSKIPNKKFSNMSWMLRLQLLKIEVLLLPFWRKWKFVSTLQLELNFSPPYRKIPQITDGKSPFHLWLLGRWELFPPSAGHLPASAGWLRADGSGRKRSPHRSGAGLNISKKMTTKGASTFPYWRQLDDSYFFGIY